MRLEKELISRIRKEVASGKTKYQVAKEFGLLESTVRYHTWDMPSRPKGEYCIRGKSFDLLKQLLSTGVIPSNPGTHGAMRNLRRHLPMIRFSRYGNHGVFYLEDKNKKALQSVLDKSKSRIVSYRELGQMLRIFDIETDCDEKKAFLGKKSPRRTRKIRESQTGYSPVHQEKQATLDDYSLVDFGIRKY